jgi:hypothetical protein
MRLADGIGLDSSSREEAGLVHVQTATDWHTGTLAGRTDWLRTGTQRRQHRQRTVGCLRTNLAMAGFRPKGGPAVSIDEAGGLLPLSARVLTPQLQCW